ncbi:MAG: polymer-forming cytoskeletal protein [Nitrospira sp.]|nr:polymer-forming cytoskeletal protein [Nitrospira sp.]MDH4249915.1 polymer-forming cytoskeletal protein [Nitrospira sp.]MDH4343420.1 polymer-forming cytoskeletal protein [Nitrospira sp.]MDH5336296.1 polymer-forming cytoskeletal protein [Nitrospira sp.]
MKMSGPLTRNVSQISMGMMIAMLVVMMCPAMLSLAWAEKSSEQAKWRERVVLSAGQEVQGDYFAFGPHVEISGTVHGDVYAAGAEVLVDGVVDGDLIVAGGEVRVSGEVTQNVRIAGGMVTLSGKIHRNATIAGGDVHLADSSHLKGSAVIGAGNLLLGGSIDGNVRIGAGNVTLSNKVDGDLVVVAAAIRLTSKASVGRNVRYWSDDEPSIDEGAVILGTVTKREIPDAFNKGEEFRRGLAGMKLVAAMVSFASTLLLGLLLLRIYPVFTPKVASMIQERPWAVLGAGGVLSFGIPLLILLCMVSVLGIPIGLMLAAMYVVTLYLGRVFVVLWLGQRLLRLVSGSSSAAWAFVTGLVTYFILSLVPFVGGLITMATIATGLGAILMTKKELVVRLRGDQVV